MRKDQKNADEMRRLIGLLLDRITDVGKLRAVYLFLNRLIVK